MRRIRVKRGMHCCPFGGRGCHWRCSGRDFTGVASDVRGISPQQSSGIRGTEVIRRVGAALKQLG